jgi:hypothetical protein
MLRLLDMFFVMKKFRRIIELIRLFRIGDSEARIKLHIACVKELSTVKAIIDPRGMYIREKAMSFMSPKKLYRSPKK